MKHIELFSSTFPIICVCVSRNEDFFSLRSNFLRCCSSRWQNIHTFYTCVVTYVHKYVRALVCKFVVLSFVQCTLDLEIFSIRFTLLLNVKFLVELYYTFDFVALLPDFPYTSHHHHRHLLIRVQSTACHIILVAHNRQYR